MNILIFILLFIIYAFLGVFIYVERSKEIETPKLRWVIICGPFVWFGFLYGVTRGLIDIHKNKKVKSNHHKWFGKNCRYLSAVWEDDERTAGPNYQEYEPEIVFCSHKKNSNNHEGNCNIYQCPINSKRREWIEHEICRKIKK
jgi:hypothetical protein